MNVAELKLDDEFKLFYRHWRVAGEYEEGDLYTTRVYLLLDGPNSPATSSHFLYLKKFEDEIERVSPQYVAGKAYKTQYGEIMLRNYDNTSWFNSYGTEFPDHDSTLSHYIFTPLEEG